MLGQLHNVLADRWGAESRHADLLNDDRWAVAASLAATRLRMLRGLLAPADTRACHDY